jgi:hypothetical protein
VKRGRFLPRPAMPAKLPPALRCFAPRLDATQVRDLGLVHVANLDAIIHGNASPQVMWDWAGGVLTWSRVAELTDRASDDMAEQLALAMSVIDRYRRTGSVGFITGSDYQIAKRGVALMDALAEFVDQPTASAAADWSEARLHALQAEVQRQAA